LAFYLKHKIPGRGTVIVSMIQHRRVAAQFIVGIPQCLIPAKFA